MCRPQGIGSTTSRVLTRRLDASSTNRNWMGCDGGRDQAPKEEGWSQGQISLPEAVLNGMQGRDKVFPLSAACVTNQLLTQASCGCVIRVMTPAPKSGRSCSTERFPVRESYKTGCKPRATAQPAQINLRLGRENCPGRLFFSLLHLSRHILSFYRSVRTACGSWGPKCASKDNSVTARKNKGGQWSPDPSLARAPPFPSPFEKMWCAAQASGHSLQLPVSRGTALRAVSATDIHVLTVLGTSCMHGSTP